MDIYDFRVKCVQLFGEEVMEEEDYWMKEWEIKKIKLKKVKFIGTKKYILGDRLQILRILIRNFFKSKIKEMTYIQYRDRCECYLDNILIKFDYNLEKCIDWMREKFKLL